jgi:hypothetical protein
MRTLATVFFGVIVHLLICFSLLTPAFAQSGEIGGVYALGKSFSSKVLSNQEVTGLSLRVPWKKIEPQKGIYDWRYLDRNIRKAHRHGKKIMIRVWAGKFTPDWVYAEGANRYYFTDKDKTISMPLPWDEVYLTEWVQFISKLGIRYSNDPDIVVVHMTGPCKYGEMHLPEKDNQELWSSLGYTEEKLIWAWMTVIDAYAEAFPDTPLAINIAQPVSFGDSLRVVQEILSYGYGKLGDRLCIQGDWLSAKIGKSFPLYQIVQDYANYANVGFQMLCDTDDKERFGGTLREAINKGLDAGASYMEIYSVDIKNPDYEEDIKYADYDLKLNEK